MKDERKPQIMALHAKGFSETAISRITGENFDEIRTKLITFLKAFLD